MSYCRWSDGQLYVVSGNGVILTCHKCPLNKRRRDYKGTKVRMLAHLKKHKAAGHCFPEDAILRLEAEVAEELLTGKPSSFYLRPLPQSKESP